MEAQLDRRAVVVGVDASEDAVRAVRWAASEAERRRAPLRLVHAFGWAEEHVPGNGLRATYRQTLLERARSQVAGAASIAAETAPGIEIAHEVVVGSPIGVLSGLSRDARLLVVGDRGASRIEGVLAGSVAVALASGAACSVVVVRGVELDRSSTATLPVVVGVDGSPTSEAALSFAYEAAAMRGVHLVAVHTWRDLSLDPVLPTLLDLNEVADAERELLAERLAGWSEKYPDVHVQRVVECARPAHTLLQHAMRAQLVVVGSHGHGEFAGLVLGSVSNALVHRSPCPVAVVRPGTRPVT